MTYPFRIRALLFVCICLCGIQNAKASDWQNLIPYCDTTFGFCGFADKYSGEVTIEPVYLSVGHFSEGFASVTTTKGVGYINGSGQIVIGPKLLHGYRFVNGYATAVIEGGVGVINRAGEFVVPPEFGDARMFSDQMAIVRKRPWPGLLSLIGWGKPPKTLRKRTEKTKWALYHTERGRLTSFKFGYAQVGLNQYWGTVALSVGTGLYGFGPGENARRMGPDGNWLTVEEGRSIVRRSKLKPKQEELPSTIRRKRQLEFHYRTALRCRPDPADAAIYNAHACQRKPLVCGGGAYHFRKNGKWGMKDVHSIEIVAPLFEALTCFKGGTAWAAIGEAGVWCKIGMDGELIWPARCSKDPFKTKVEYNTVQWVSYEGFKRSVAYQRQYKRKAYGLEVEPEMYVFERLTGRRLN